MAQDRNPAVSQPRLLEKLRRRYSRHSLAYPRIHWKPWLAGSLTLAAIAALFVDRHAIEWVRAEPTILHDIAADVTDAGKSGWILITAAGLGIGTHFFGRRLNRRLHRLRSIRLAHACLFVFLSIAGSGLTANVLKRAIGRARPPLMDQLGTFSFHPFAQDYDFESFPSGHSTTDGAIAMSLAILFPSLRIPLLSLGFLLALTRTMVGAHYPSDVIGGYAFGIWFALFTAIIFARYGILFRNGIPGYVTPQKEGRPPGGK